MDTRTVIVSGSRTIRDYDTVKQAIEESPWYGAIDTVFVGDANGVDRLTLRWCRENGITFRIFKADWEFYGKGAGPVRNKEMIQSGGQALIAIWDGESRGTAHMIFAAKEYGIPVFVKTIEAITNGPEVKV